MHEDKAFPDDVRELAALVASKVYYHLGSYEDSLKYALGAGKLFDFDRSVRGEWRPQSLNALTNTQKSVFR